MTEFLTRPASYKKKTRVGRGGAHGKTSGRGHKGQKSRAGNKRRSAILDEMQRIPKRRGFNKNRARTVWAERPRPVSIPLHRIISLCIEGDDKKNKINPKVLIEAGVCEKRSGRIPSVKIIGSSDSLSVPIICTGCEVSAGAKQCIEKAGGSVS